MSEAAKDEWEKESSPNPSKVWLPTFRKYGEDEPFRKRGESFAVVEARNDALGDRLMIVRLHSVPRGQGSGTSLLDFLKRLADRYRIRIELTAEPYYPTEPQQAKSLMDEKHERAQLIAWYQKRGFVQKFWGMDSMWYPDVPLEP